MRKSERGCCGIASKTAKPTHSIALYNVLDADLSPEGLTITYAEPASKEDVSVSALRYPFAPEEKAAYA